MAMVMQVGAAVFIVILLMVQMRRNSVVQYYSVYTKRVWIFPLPVSQRLIPAKLHFLLSSVFVTGTHRD